MCPVSESGSMPYGLEFCMFPGSNPIRNTVMQQSPKHGKALVFRNLCKQTAFHVLNQIRIIAVYMFDFHCLPELQCPCFPCSPIVETVCSMYPVLQQLLHLAAEHKLWETQLCVSKNTHQMMSVCKTVIFRFLVTDIISVAPIPFLSVHPQEYCQQDHIRYVRFYSVGFNVS